MEKKRKMLIQAFLFELRCHRGQPHGSRQQHSEEDFKDEVKKKAQSLRLVHSAGVSILGREKERSKGEFMFS